MRVSTLYSIVLLGLATAPAAAQRIDWYGQAQTSSFTAYCKPGLANRRSAAYRYCDTVWNAFKEGFFTGLDTANKTCFIDRAQLEDLIAYIEGKGEEYISGTGWVFTMRDFAKSRLERCFEERGRGGMR